MLVLEPLVRLGEEGAQHDLGDPGQGPARTRRIGKAEQHVQTRLELPTLGPAAAEIEQGLEMPGIAPEPCELGLERLDVRQRL